SLAAGIEARAKTVSVAVHSMTARWRRSAPEKSAPDKSDSLMTDSRKLAPASLAPRRLQRSRTLPERLAPVRSASAKSIPSRTWPSRMSRSTSALSISCALRLEPESLRDFSAIHEPDELHVRLVERRGATHPYLREIYPEEVRTTKHGVGQIRL